GNGVPIPFDHPDFQQNPKEDQPDEQLPQQLLLRGQAQIPLHDHFDVVVKKTDDPVTQRGEEKEEQVGVHHFKFNQIGEGKRRQDDGRENDRTAHRGSSRLFLVRLRSFFSDALSEFKPLQNGYEHRAQKDADEKCHQYRDENDPDIHHVPDDSLFIKSCTTRSRRTIREAFTKSKTPSFPWSLNVLAASSSEAKCSARISLPASFAPSAIHFPRSPKVYTRRTPFSTAYRPISR